MRGVPAFAADESEADADEDDAEDRAPKQGLMIPASMGLRFQIPADLEAFTVTASWGIYETVQTDKVTKAGRADPPLPAHPGREPRTDPARRSRQPVRRATIPLRDTICLRIDRYDDPAFGRVLVEIALCNDRETPRKIPVEMWMFQTKLYVDAGGAEVFLPVCDPCSSRTGPSTTTSCGG